jgi:hypothetical protein
MRRIRLINSRARKSFIAAALPVRSRLRGG